MTMDFNHDRAQVFVEYQKAYRHILHLIRLRNSLVACTVLLNRGIGGAGRGNTSAARFVSDSSLAEV